MTIPDSASRDAPEAPATVGLAEPRDKAYWARYFQVPQEDVEAAVAAVGSDASKVAAHLGRPWPFEASGIV